MKVETLPPPAENRRFTVDTYGSQIWEQVPGFGRRLVCRFNTPLTEIVEILNRVYFDGRKEGYVRGLKESSQDV